MIEETIILLIAIALIIVLTSLPLYLSVKLLGGHATILSVFFVNIITAVLIAGLFLFFGLHSLVVLLIVALFYSWVFEMGFFRSLFAWFLQYVIAFVLLIALITIGVVSL